MIQQIIKRRYILFISRFVSVFLHSNKVAAADESPPVLALYRISRSDCACDKKGSPLLRHVLQEDGKNPLAAAGQNSCASLLTRVPVLHENFYSFLPSFLPSFLLLGIRLQRKLEERETLIFSMSLFCPRAKVATTNFAILHSGEKDKTFFHLKRARTHAAVA
jgi:hypothetical protein